MVCALQSLINGNAIVSEQNQVFGNIFFNSPYNGGQLGTTYIVIALEQALIVFYAALHNSCRIKCDCVGACGVGKGILDSAAAKLQGLCGKLGNFKTVHGCVKICDCALCDKALLFGKVKISLSPMCALLGALLAITSGEQD